MRHGCFKLGGNLWRWAIVGLILLGLLGWIGSEQFTAYAHLAEVQARRLTVRGEPAVQLLIQTDQGAGKEIIVQVGPNVIIFKTDSRGRVDTGHMEVPEGATSVVVKMPDPGDDLWPAECTIPLAEIPQGRYERVAACMDLEPPITPFSQEPEKNRYGWNNSPVEVTLSATDEKSGVKQICYELSGAISQPERCVAGDQVSFTIPESPNGTTTVRFFAEDRWVDRGTPKPNREEPKTEVVRIDTGRPSISASLSPEPNEHGWNNEPVHISFHCSDSLSGIASCTGDRTVSTEGARQAVTGHAKDRAGNANSTTVYVNIDLTKPVIRQVGSATCSQPGNNGWCRGEVTVPFEASDALSGFAGGEHTIRFTKSTSREGEAVYISSGTVEDLAGNEADPISAGPFKIDHTPPSINLSASSPQPGEPAVVSWEITDGLSGVDPGSCLVTLSGPGITGVGGRQTLSTDCHGQLRLTYEQYGAGTFTVRAEARDLAGNGGSGERSFTIPEPYCAIEGRVVDATTDRPIAGASVGLSPTGRTATTDAEGRFSFTELMPDTYTVTAEAPDYSPSSRAVECRAGETAELVLALSPIPGQPPPWPLTETLDLGYGDVVERDTGFESSEDVKVYKVNMPAGATLTVQVRDCCIPGDIWRAEIYESYPAMKAATEGDGSIEDWSSPAQATISSGVAYVVIKYVEGVDVWPAGMSIRFEVSG